MTPTTDKNDSTNHKCKLGVDLNGGLDLKKTRETTKKANRVVRKTNPPPVNDSPKVESKLRSSKMEKRLARAKTQTRSLPDELHLHLMSWAKCMIANVMKKAYFEKDVPT